MPTTRAGTSTEDNHLLEAIKGLSENILKLNENFVKHSTTIEELLIALNRRTSDQNAGNYEQEQGQPVSRTFTSQIAEAMNKQKLIDLTYQAKRSIRNWKQQLNMRNQAFEHEIRNRTVSKLYDEWLAKDEPFIPKKFRPKLVENEPEDQLRIKKWVSMQNVKGETLLMTKRADSHRERYRKIDSEMTKLFQDKFTGIIGERLLTLWNEEIDRGQAQAITTWEKKEQWFRTLESKEDTQPTNNTDSNKNKSKKRDSRSHSGSRSRSGSRPNNQSNSRSRSQSRDRKSSNNRPQQNKVSFKPNQNKGPSQQQRRRPNGNGNKPARYRRNSNNNQSNRGQNNSATNNTWNRFLGRGRRRKFTRRKSGPQTPRS